MDYMTRKLSPLMLMVSHEQGGISTFPVRCFSAPSPHSPSHLFQTHQHLLTTESLSAQHAYVGFRNLVATHLSVLSLCTSLLSRYLSHAGLLAIPRMCSSHDKELGDIPVQISFHNFSPRKYS